MAFTFNGIGTTYYGQRDFGADGSYVTTKWFVIGYVPLIPLSSLRVIYRGASTDGIPFLLTGTNYSVLEQGPLNWSQVLATYGYITLLVGWWTLAVKAAFRITPQALNTLQNVYAVFFTCLLPIPIPWILRFCAKRKVHG